MEGMFYPKYSSPSTDSKNRVLVLADYPDYRDKSDRGGYIQRGYSYVIKDVLPALECGWVFQCVYPYTLEKDKKPTAAQYRSTKDLIKELVAKVRPRAIICLGKDALNHVMGEHSPKTMKDIKGSYMDHPEWNTRVFSCSHPAMFYAREANKDALLREYEEVFSKAEAHCLETSYRPRVNYRLITSPQDLQAIMGKISKKFAFDVETGVHDKFMNKNTIWKDGSCLISLSITCKSQGRDYENYVIAGNALMDRYSIERIFKDRIAVAWNIKYDAQALFRYLDIDIFKLVQDFEDSMVEFYLTDQNRLENALKKVAPRYLQPQGCTQAWDDELPWLVCQANQAIHKAHKEIADEIKRLATLNGIYMQLQELNKEMQELSAVPVLLGEQKKKLASLKRQVASREAKLGPDYCIFKTNLLIGELRRRKNTLPPEGSADYRDIPLTKLAEYNAEDTLRTLQLHLEVLPKLPELEKNDYAFYEKATYDRMKRIIRMLCYVERNGLPIDAESVLEYEKELKEVEQADKEWLLSKTQVQAVVEKLSEAGEDTKNPLVLNKLVSPKNQKFMTALAKDMGFYHLGNRTKTTVTFGKKVLPVVKATMLEAGLEPDSEPVSIIDKLTALRDNLDLRSKFLKSWQKFWVKDPDGWYRFHANYVAVKNQNLGYVRSSSEEGGASTGRLGANSPNLQQIQKLKHLRRHFKARKGWFFCECDYKSLEPMIIAFLSNCKFLIDAFLRELDIYQLTADQILNLGVDLSQPDHVVREQLAKAVNDDLRTLYKVGFLAWVYGRGVKQLSEQLGISEEETLAFYAAAKVVFAEIYEWKNDIAGRVKNGELVYTILGRKRSFPVAPINWNDPEDQLRRRRDLAKAIRVSINYCVQSVGNDICLDRVAAIQEYILANNLEDVVRIVNVVHDSAWFECKITHAYLIPVFIKTMEDLSSFEVKITVPLKVEPSFGYDLSQTMDKAESKRIGKELGLIAA